MYPADLPSRLLPLLLITGLAGAVSISVSQSHVIGYEGRSALLSAAYNVSKSPEWLQIRWTLSTAPSITLGLCTIRSSGKGVDISRFPADGYERRMHIIPENGSLVINPLRRSDAGTYHIEVLGNKLAASASINLTVTEPGAYNSPSDNCMCTNQMKTQQTRSRNPVLVSVRVTPPASTSPPQPGSSWEAVCLLSSSLCLFSAASTYSTRNRRDPRGGRPDPTQTLLKNSNTLNVSQPSPPTDSTSASRSSTSMSRSSVSRCSASMSRCSASTSRSSPSASRSSHSASHSSASASRSSASPLAFSSLVSFCSSVFLSSAFPPT